MRFGEYVRRRRKELHFRQQDMKGFDQSYISRIEKGEYNPTKRETIEQLAEALHIQKLRLDWFWVYSLLDRDPDTCFGRTGGGDGYPVLADSAGVYTSVPAVTLHPGDTPAMVQAQLGPPTKIVRIPTAEKWWYEPDGIHVIFEHGRVAEVAFK